MPEKSETTKQVAAKVQNVDAEARKQAEANKITSRFMKTKTVKTGEDTDHEQTYLLQFPGTVNAQDIFENAQNLFGNINKRYFMQEAVKRVVVAPKIKDLGWFDTHHGFNELFDEIFSFLTDRLN